MHWHMISSSVMSQIAYVDSEDGLIPSGLSPSSSVETNVSILPALQSFTILLRTSLNTIQEWVLQTAIIKRHSGLMVWRLLSIVLLFQAEGGWSGFNSQLSRYYFFPFVARAGGNENIGTLDCYSQKLFLLHHCLKYLLRSLPIATDKYILLPHRPPLPAPNDAPF